VLANRLIRGRRLTRGGTLVETNVPRKQRLRVTFPGREQ
jgi:hypothetical protein